MGYSSGPWCLMVICRVPEDPIWALEQRLLILTTLNFDDIDPVGIGFDILFPHSFFLLSSIDSMVAEMMQEILVLLAAASYKDYSNFRLRPTFTFYLNCRFGCTSLLFLLLFEFFLVEMASMQD